MTYKQSVIKQTIEYILIFPIVLMGKLYGQISMPSKKYTHFLFFPSADIGGSIKVNSEIAECIKASNPLIIFSKKPKNNKFCNLFKIDGVDIIDLSNKIDNKYYHFINIFYRGVLSVWINSAKKPVVFGGESLYFYKIIPHLKSKVKIVELCHLNTWFNYSQAFIKKINYRIASTPKIKRDLEHLYTQNNISIEYFNKLLFIDNKVDIPSFRKTTNELLEVIYVGRGAPQKRIYLLVKIVQQCHQLKLPVHFTFIGDVDSFFDEKTKKMCTLLGEIADRNKLEDIYDKADALILTSAYEGLPLVVMDMMARGKVVISTAVDGIPDYVKNLETGLLIENNSESEIVENGVKMIELLIQNPSLKSEIEERVYHFAKSHFSNKVFDNFYKNILEA